MTAPYTMTDLVPMTRAELLAIHNAHAERPLASFKDHPTAVARTAAVLGLNGAHEEAQEEAEEPGDVAAATHTTPAYENEPSIIYGAPSEDDDTGPDYLDLSSDTEDEIEAKVAASAAKYDPTSDINIERAAKYNFVSPEAYVAAVQAKHVYKKAVTAKADNVAELKARWQNLEKVGKGRKAKKSA